MYSERLEQLHTVCNSYAPNALAQESFVHIRRAMEGACEPEGDIAKAMIRALLDGLAYGNW